MKITIIGSGAMGTAMAQVLFDSNQKDITIYGIDQQELEDLNNGKNTKYFGDLDLPFFKTTNNLEIALNQVDMIVMAIPSKVMDIILDKIIPLIKNEVIIVNVSKGFYPNTTFSLQQGIRNKTQNIKYVKSVVTLTGPSHAEEIVKKALTSICVVGKNEEDAKKIQQIFNNNYFRLYYQKDEIGSEIGAIYKNILAIASGIFNGFGYSINTVAALLARGLHEAKILVDFFGGNSITLLGLTGVGDLIVTAMSPLSRNYSFGLEFAELGQQALQTNKTVEGLTALKEVKVISDKNNLNLPIANALYNLIFNNVSFDDIVKQTFARSLKDEFI